MRPRPPHGCGFCLLGSAVGRNGRVVVAETAELIAFTSKHPRAAVHCIIAPKEHVRQLEVHSLGLRRPALLRGMLDLGEQLLVEQQVPVGTGRLMFHAPPLFNSVDHLHMHVLGGPFVNWYRDIAHRTDPWTPWGIAAHSLMHVATPPP